MPSNYELIRNDDRRKDDLLDRALTLLGKMYSDRTHFIFELLQNAEDAGASRILFRLLDDRLEVTHDGRPFDERDVIGICGVGEGTKAEDLTQIGKFGIGFKSVYAYTSTPEVHSGDESFRIQNYVRPFPVEPRRAGDSWTTLFVFAFDAVGIDPKIACRKIGERLLNLSARTLLFLRKIKQIDYQLPDLTEGFYLRQEGARGPARHITLWGQNNGKEVDEKWLVFERPVPVPDGTYNVRVEVGFRLETRTKDAAEVFTRIEGAQLVVYFPTETPTGLGFLIQGPYRTTPSRDNVPKDDSWNATLVKETALLLTDVLVHLKETKQLTVSLLEVLRPWPWYELPMFLPIVVAIREALQNKELLPADDGTYVSARNAKLARSTVLRELLKQERLRTLYQSTDEIKWLAGEITQDRMPFLHAYLLKDLGVEEVMPDVFARKITLSFLASQSDDWFVELYAFLLGLEALWRCPRFPGDTSAGLLRAKPILRIQDDSQIVPFQMDGITPMAFLPPPEDTDFTVVKRTIANNERVRDFLSRLGLAEPNAIDEVVERVLPRYTRPDASLISSSEHATDIRKIVRAMGTDSETGKRKVTQAAEQTPFLKAVDRSGKTAFLRPVDVYFPTQQLLDYFSGCSDVWFLDETEGEKEWRDLGVEDIPRFKKNTVDLPEDERRKLRQREQSSYGCTCERETIDYDLDGLEGFLARISKGEAPFEADSLVVWNFLLEHLRRSGYYRFYHGEYKWKYWQERSARFDATWQKRLLFHAWLPKKGGDALQSPGELRMVDLPGSFSRNTDLAQLLRMKKDVDSALAEQAGIQPEDIELIRQHPDEFRQFKADLAARSETPVFPTRTVVNEARRREQLVKQLADAPVKDYEERERSVRTTRGFVDSALWLRSQYTNDLGQMLCQICKSEMPFKKRDGEYYFEAVEALSREHFNREMEAQFLALCPLCAAMYKEFLKLDQSAMNALAHTLKTSDSPDVSLKLGDLETSVRFVETHFSDIKTILAADE